VDAGNWVPDGLEVGFDREADARRWPTSAGGVVVIPRGAFPAQPFQRVPAAPAYRPVFTPAETLDWGSLDTALETTESHPGAVKPPSRPAAARDKVVAG